MLAGTYFLSEMKYKKRYSKHRRGKSGLFAKLAKQPVWKLVFCAVAVCAIYLFLFKSVFLSPKNTLVWKALFGETKYPDGYSVQGIDISHYQGEIDWDKLHGALIEGNPVRFIIMKSTEGNSMLDKNFKHNFYQASQYGFIRGAYHFFVPGIDARSQAEHFLKQVSLEEGDLPPVLDFERTGNLTKEQIEKDALEWLRMVEKRYHVKPVLYTYYKFKLKYFSSKEFDDYPYWIAHYYVDTLRYQGAWKFWQHTDYGKVDGIKSYVDLNVYNGSMYDLEKFTIGNRRADDE